MMANILLLLLAGGLPYYLLLERSERFGSKQIFLLSAFLLFCAITLSIFIPNSHMGLLVLIAFANALFSIYRATKTTNFYKLGYLLIFINAPFFMLFEEAGALYSLSLLITLIGIFLVGRFYEKSYGSANFHYIRGVTLSTPYMGTFMTIYLVSIALYPPFPNAIFFFSHILHSDMNLLWYLVVITLFFGNFMLAMKVMRESLFGRPNPNIHYFELSSKDMVPHFATLAMLLLLSIYGLKEILL